MKSLPKQKVVWDVMQNLDADGHGLMSCRKCGFTAEYSNPDRAMEEAAITPECPNCGYAGEELPPEQIWWESDDGSVCTGTIIEDLGSQKFVNLLQHGDEKFALGEATAIVHLV